jgi:hypothetical protein
MTTIKPELLDELLAGVTTPDELMGMQASSSS